MWNNSSFPFDINSAVSISLPDSVVILTTISSVLSVFGAITIFLSYFVVREARNFTRLLLMHVTVADLITCVGTFVGSIRYFLRNEDDYIIKEKHQSTVLEPTMFVLYRALSTRSLLWRLSSGPQS